MRVLCGIASLTISVALLVGCSSSSQGTPALPNSASPRVTLPMDHSGAGQQIEFPKGHISREAMIKWWLAGKMTPLVPHEALKQQLKIIESHRTYRPKTGRASGAPAIWVSLYSFDYLIGQTIDGKTTVSTVNLGSNGCQVGYGIKSDHSQNIWIPCEIVSASNHYAGSAQEYSNTGVLRNNYKGGCPTNIAPSQCQSWDASVDDVATSGTGAHDYVFVSDEYFQSGYKCGSATCYGNGTGFAYWPRANPSAQSTVINLYNQSYGGVTVDEVSYFDLDATGNIYSFYYGCEIAYPYDCGEGILEIVRPTHNNWSVTMLTQPDFDSWGGVYVNPCNAGCSGVLNVADDDPSIRTILQYVLPWTGRVADTLGPTPTNSVGCGEPFYLGFAKGDRKAIYSDLCDWLNMGQTRTNTWKAVGSLNFVGISGAAYTESDK